MQKQATDFFGELSDSHACVRDAGKQEERNRILVEIVLALDRGRENSWVRDALLELKHFIDNPRTKEEQDRLLLQSIMAVAIPK
jgi:hypothetical protein